MIRAAILACIVALGAPPQREHRPRMSEGCEPFCKAAVDECKKACAEVEAGQGRSKCNDGCKKLDKPCMDKCEAKQKQRAQRGR